MGGVASGPSHDDAVNLRAAANNGDKATLTRLLKKYPELVNMTDHVRNILFCSH